MVSVELWVKHEVAQIIKQKLDNLRETLYAADAAIRNIVMFGSFVYAPSLARGIIDTLYISFSYRGDYLVDDVG